MNPKPTRRRGRLRIQLCLVPATDLVQNPNNPHSTQDPTQRRRELLDSLAAALAKLADHRLQQED